MPWTQDCRQGRATAFGGLPCSSFNIVRTSHRQTAAAAALHRLLAQDGCSCVSWTMLVCPFRCPCTIPFRDCSLPVLINAGGVGPHPHPSTNQPKKMHPLNKAASCLCLQLQRRERRGRSSRATNNGDLLQQGQGGPRRRRVPPPPLDHRRRLHAHQARLEGRQPGRHGRLPGTHRDISLAFLQVSSPSGIPTSCDVMLTGHANFSLPTHCQMHPQLCLTTMHRIHL